VDDEDVVAVGAAAADDDDDGVGGGTRRKKSCKKLSGTSMSAPAKPQTTGRTRRGGLSTALWMRKV
jgi:hypothetical protein